MPFAAWPRAGPLARACAPTGNAVRATGGCAGRGRALAAQRSLPPVLALNIRSRNRGVRRQAHSIYARHHAPKRRRRFRRQRRAPTRRSCPLPSPPSFLLSSSSFGKFAQPSFQFQFNLLSTNKINLFFPRKGGGKKVQIAVQTNLPGHHHHQGQCYFGQTTRLCSSTRAARAPGDAGCGRAAAGSGVRAETMHCLWRMRARAAAARA